MAYIGNIPAESYASFLTETFSVSATANYTLSHAVTNENDIRLVINGVVQQPGSGKAYTASGTTLTLTSATVSGDVMYAVYLGRALQTVNPPAASVGNSQTAPTIITGQTAETSIATDDQILIHDTSASALRKMTRANFVSGIGGTNTPNFFAYVSSNFNISSDTETILAFNAELYDTASAFNTSNYTFTVPSGQAGKYFLFGQTRKNNFSGTRTFIQIFKTPSGGSAADIFIAENSGGSDGYITIGGSAVANLSVGDALQVRVYHNDSGSRGFFGDATNTFFGGYKLIE